MVEVAVCRFGEDLAWTRNLPRGVRLTVYEKSPPDQTPWPGSIPLENHSRDDFAWLHHLVERYDDLAELTVFAQGRPFDHAPDLHRVIRSYVKEEIQPDCAWLGFLWETDDARGRPSFVTWSKNPERRELNLEGFFQAMGRERSGKSSLRRRESVRPFKNRGPSPLARFLSAGAGLIPNVSGRSARF